MSYRRCSQDTGHPEDRCWRVEGHLDEHRFAPLMNSLVAEDTAKKDLLIQAELGRLVVLPVGSGSRRVT